MVDYIGMDFETFGAVDLPKRGLDNYVKDPSFQPLICSVAQRGAPPVTYDFVFHPERDRKAFKYALNSYVQNGDLHFAAHNSGFERAVLGQMGLRSVIPLLEDSAVVARMMGAASSLEAAAPQLTNINKLEVGKELIQLFSVPNDRNGGRPFTADEIQADTELWDKWQLFKEYCEQDAVASRELCQQYQSVATHQEHQLEWLTYRMNQVGWAVDLDRVREMKLRYEENTAQIASDFMTRYSITSDTFLNSTPQMQTWCAERGVKTRSFDVEHIERLWTRLNKRMASMGPFNPRYADYSAVLDLLQTKRELGGSSLKKLQVILDLVSPDGRLRNQYMHVGAGQSYRTTGKGVQMQNLKRLSSHLLDMELLDDPANEIDNGTMAENLRQVFWSEDPQGALIVGDFSSVESRGLAWVAGADWKTEAYRAGKDLYKVQAASIFHKPYESITKDERQTGKVGELSCGYGAGAGSVLRFAAKMGIEMTDTESSELVNNWRETNPETVDLWRALNEALHMFVETKNLQQIQLANGLRLELSPCLTPSSLQKQHPGAQSMKMDLYADGRWFMERTFHGLYRRGKDICMYKPTDRKTGALWKSHYRDPKTGVTVFYKLYGGKLTGILVQSMCRELFFHSLDSLSTSLILVSNAKIIGQFHDEIVVEWAPSSEAGALSLEAVQAVMSRCMSKPPQGFSGFPLEADIKHARRYIK